MLAATGQLKIKIWVDGPKREWITTGQRPYDTPERSSFPEIPVIMDMARTEAGSAFSD